MIAICREMGWDYWIYQSQPMFFLEAVKDFLVKEQKEKLKALQKQKQAARNGR